MNAYFNTISLIRKTKTEIWGLSYAPSLEPHVSNDQDNPAFSNYAPVECSDCNRAVVAELVASMGTNLKTIMEIGIARPENGANSMSFILMEKKPADCAYFGVDLDDRSYLDSAEKNIHTIRSDSFQQEKIRAWLQEKGVTSLDMLFIDGWHSVNACINDWLYTDLLSPNGVVVLHDTNAHPGPVVLLDAVDDELFTKERFCTENDNGIAVLRRRTA